MSRRHVNICDTELCTSDIDDNLICDDHPSTEGLSLELSELMRNPYDKKQKRSRNSSSKMTADIIRLFDMIKQINKEINSLKNGLNPDDNYVDEIMSRMNSKANKTDLAFLDEKVEEMAKMLEEYESVPMNPIHSKSHKPRQQNNCNQARVRHQPVHHPPVQHQPTHTQKSHQPQHLQKGISREITRTLCVDGVDTELQKYIDCKINEAVDPVLELLNAKCAEYDKKLDDLNKIMVNALKNYPVYC